MQDDTVTINELKKAVEAFVAEREWQKFHTAKNMSMAIAVEAAELMEVFVWIDSADSAHTFKEKRKEVEDEVADVFIDLLEFCNVCDIDLADAFFAKLESTKKKYPADKVKGRSDKYTEYLHE